MTPFVLVFLLIAQKGAIEIDPLLSDDLRPAVERAIAAELDPKRGAGNAIEILKAKRKELEGHPEAQLSLDLRAAGIALREKFTTSTEFPESIRPVQALSTYSKLDLLEPGLSNWIDRALAQNPDAQKALGPRNTWRIKAALLTRGSGLDKELVKSILTNTFKTAGVRLEIVPPKDAPMAIRVSAEDAPGPKAAVRVTIDLQSIDRGKMVWEQSLFRTESAEQFEVALKSALGWAARIGGRDLLFRWLGEHAFPALEDPTPHVHGAPHSHPGDHAQKGEIKTKVQIPKER